MVTSEFLLLLSYNNPSKPNSIEPEIEIALLFGVGYSLRGGLVWLGVAVVVVDAVVVLG
jgi:hypothetical protein